MSFTEKCFWLVLGSFAASVSYGLGYQAIFSEAALVTPLLPLMITVGVVHVMGAWFRQDRAITDLWVALLIWLYFPLAATMGFVSAAIGCTEGIITSENFTSLFLFVVSAANLAIATWLTAKFIRLRQIDASARVLPFVLKSAAFQIAFGPLLIVASNTAN